MTSAYKELLHNKLKNKKDLIWVERYIKFIEYFENNIPLNNFEKHHILPKSIDMFPEYSSFTKHKENCIKLPLRAHYLAHYMLAKAFKGKQWYSFNVMNRVYKNSILYEKNRIYLSEIISKNNTGKKVKESVKKLSSERTKLMWLDEDLRAQMLKTRKENYPNHSSKTKEKMSNNGIKTKIKIFFFEKEIFIKKEIFYLYEEQGWQIGCSEQNLKKYSETSKDKLFFYNPETNNMVKCIEGEQPAGYIKGRINGTQAGLLKMNGDKSLITVRDIRTGEIFRINKNKFLDFPYCLQTAVPLERQKIFIFQKNMFFTYTVFEKYMLKNGFEIKNNLDVIVMNLSEFKASLYYNNILEYKLYKILLEV